MIHVCLHSKVTMLRPQKVIPWLVEVTALKFPLFFLLLYFPQASFAAAQITCHSSKGYHMVITTNVI